jgi:hypothetical protein
MKTHKNPELRASGAVPDKAPVVVASAAASKAPAVVKPPRFELQDKKWVVENQVSQCCFLFWLTWRSCMLGRQHGFGDIRRQHQTDRLCTELLWKG